MDNLPAYIYLVFGLTILVTICLFYKATNYSKTFLILMSLWIAFQTIISILGFYKITNVIPPRFLLLLVPPSICIISIFNTTKGKVFIDSLNIKILTIIHIIRTPVEIVLFWLFMYKAIPELMTFEGRNFDIFSGLSAPIVYYFAFFKTNLNKNILLVWNFVCLTLVLNIVFNAILSAPTQFQQFAFEQPNIAIQYFPFVLLPACLIPLVLFSHLVTIRQLLINKTN